MLITPAELKRSTPEAVGLSSKSILDFIEATEAAELELHSLMVVKNGNVAAEGWWAPYAPEDVHLLYSLSKSFTATAIGFAIQDGLVGLDDPIISFFPSQLPSNPSNNLQAMKVRHLLSMSTGHAADDMSELYAREDQNWVRGFLARTVEFEPGTHFLYNSSASYVLSAIITRVTGLSTLDYLRPRLLDPIGIEKASWETCPNGISVGGWGLSITTDAIARFGLLYLQKGVWNGQRLISEEWVEEATKFQVSNEGNDQPDWRQGYGFQFWRSRHGCYRGDGAFGQFCVVVPQFEMVVALTAAVSSMQAVLDLVWELLYANASAGSIAEDEAAGRELKVKLASLKLPGPVGLPTSPATEASNRTFVSDSSEGQIKGVSYAFDDAGCVFTIQTEKGNHLFHAESCKWVHGESTFETPDPKKIACIGAWTSEDTYEIKVRYTEMPSGITFTSRFSGDSVNLISTPTCRLPMVPMPDFAGHSS